MKICFVIYSLGNGGAERVLSTLANHFSTEHTIEIVTFSTDTPFYPLVPSIGLHSIGTAIASSNLKEALKNNFISIQKLKKVFSDIEPDIVISFMTTSNILTTIASIGSHIPLIISERTNHDALSSSLWRAIRTLTYPFADALVVQSNYDLKKYFFIRNKSILHNPLFFHSKECRQKEREKIILAVGRLERVKGFDMLIEAYERSKTDYTLIIVGEGSERRRLEKMIVDKHLQSKVILEGRQSDILDYYARASLFVLSSRMEGFPNVLCEAMACGCPVIAFDCKTGPSDIIEHNKNGILVEANNIEKLSQQIKYLCDNISVRQYLAKNAQRIIDTLHIETIARQWMDVIEKTIARKK